MAFIENKGLNSSPHSVVPNHSGLAKQFNKFHGVLK